MPRPTGIQKVADSILGPGTYVSLRFKFGHEIISTAILSLPLIQEGPDGVYWLENNDHF